MNASEQSAGGGPTADRVGIVRGSAGSRKSTFRILPDKKRRTSHSLRAGPLGRLVLHGLKQAGLRPITFADNNERAMEHDIEGVLSLRPLPHRILSRLGVFRSHDL